jgi:hypothetical protein
MSATTDFDGLCGNIPFASCSSRQVRCKYKFGHEGPHSYERTYTKDFIFGFYKHPVEKYTQVKKRDHIDQLEYDRGKFDAEHNWPPHIMVGPYAEGYGSVVKDSYWDSFRYKK